MIIQYRTMLCFFLLFFSVYADIFSEIDSVYIDIAGSSRTNLTLRGTDSILYSFEREVHASGFIPPNEFLAIFSRAIIDTNELEIRGTVMDGPTNDSYFQLIYSDGKRMILHFSGGAIFGSGSFYTSQGRFQTVRTNRLLENSNEVKELKGERYVLTFSKDDQLALYNLISKYRRTMLGDASMPPIHYEEH